MRDERNTTVVELCLILKIGMVKNMAYERVEIVEIRKGKCVCR